MLDFIMPASEFLKASDPEDLFFALSFLAQSLEEIYLSYYCADTASSIIYAEDPFHDPLTHELTENAAKYKYAFVTYDLYEALKVYFESKGYVVKTSSQELSTRFCGFYELKYYSGSSIIFVPRK